MSVFFEISGLNIYIQILVILISVMAHLLAKRSKKGLNPLWIYIIGLAGWFSVISSLFGHIIYADEVASGIG